MENDNSINELMNGLYDKLKVNTSFVDYEYIDIFPNELSKILMEHESDEKPFCPYFFEKFNQTHRDYKLKNIRHIRSSEITDLIKLTNNQHERGRIIGNGKYCLRFSIYFDKV
jgi:hypothetical protein